MDDGANVSYIKDSFLNTLKEGKDYIKLNYQVDLVSFNGSTSKGHLIKILVNTKEQFWHHFWVVSSDDLGKSKNKTDVRIGVHLQNILDIRKSIPKLYLGFEAADEDNKNEIEFLEDSPSEFGTEEISPECQKELEVEIQRNRKIEDSEPILQCQKLPFSKKLYQTGIKVKQYPIPHRYLKFLKENTLEKLKKGQVQKAANNSRIKGQSSYPVWITPKANGKLRRVDDLRVLNSYLPDLSNTLPKIHDLFSKLEALKRKDTWQRLI
eukprot:gene7044-11207_t